MGRRVKLCALILLLGTVTLGVHRVYLANSRGYETVQPQDRSQRVQPRDQSQPMQPQDRSQPVQPQDQRLPAQLEDQSQPVNQHEMIRSEIQSQPRQAPQAPQSGATTGPKGVPNLYRPHHYHDLCLVQGNPNGNYSHQKIVHYVYVSDASPHLTFRQYLSVLSSHKFFRPERILLHSNVAPSGKYWDLAVKTTGIEYNHVERVRRIGGKAPGWVQHEADYIKVSQVLLYGGVALDFDAVILNGTKLRDEQRRGECVLSGENSCTYLNIGVFSCVKGSRYLHDWREGYHKDYRPYLWLYNSCTNTPTDLVKKGIYEVVIDPDISQYPSWSVSKKEWLGTGRKVDWRGKAASHYFCRGAVQDGTEILDMDNSLGEMFRYIYQYDEYQH